MMGTCEELEKLNQMFMMLDTQKKGKINKKDMKEGMKKVLGKMKSSEFEFLMDLN
jgi:Ca2+-binding EF-hand superfamily protein